MRVEKKHAHAYTNYSLLSWWDYVTLMGSAVEAKVNNYKSLSVHLPFEIQHEGVQNLREAISFIYFGEFLKRVFGIKLYWENAPWLKVGSWNLKYGNTVWINLPRDIDLCLDTGHLMLGEKDKRSFLKKLKLIIHDRGGQIKHLHLHENDFRSDQHLAVPGRVITSKMIKELTKNRSYIFEKGE